MNEDRLLMWAKIAATTTATSVALFLFASAVVGQSNKLTLEQAHII
jgi:hypothetical protein